jgi:RNA polymerase sigma-70 factor (ECF subfamily)
MSHSEVRRRLLALLPRLRRFALVLTRSGDAADDLLQSALERALSRLDQWQPDSHLDRWMFAIIRSVWLNGQRAAAIRRADALEDHEQALSADGEATALAAVGLAEVREAFAQLSPEQRQALLLVGVEGYTYAEAAEFLGLPIGTVISRLTRGRLALAAALQQQRPSNVTLFRQKGLQKGPRP